MTVGEFYAPHNQSFPEWAPFLRIPELDITPTQKLVFSHVALMKITPDADIESELREVEVEA